MSMEDFTAYIDVSRETLARLEAYLTLLKRWQGAINLVGPATLADPWRRHLLDSAQLMRHVPKEAGTIYDLGSGAGLPGVILAIMGKADVHLVESDQRKAQFLREVARSLNLGIDIHAQRIECLPSKCAGVVTARALAPLSRLLDLAVPLLRPDSICLFLKGRSASDELTEARKCWRMSLQSFPSLSDSSASVLKLRDIASAPLYRE
ncbi:MAG: 16S rRNA (guanine(527)-N(7))-methyltransferase RsmG [Geminicoccaceae bacterium]